MPHFAKSTKSSTGPDASKSIELAGQHTMRRASVDESAEFFLTLACSAMASFRKNRLSPQVTANPSFESVEHRPGSATAAAAAGPIPPGSLFVGASDVAVARSSGM
jgi:hypothetical protein